MKGPSGFYSSLGLLLLLNAVIKPVWIFAIDRQVQNTVGTETYGIYFSLFGLSVVLSFLADWGFTFFFNRQLAARDKDLPALPGQFLVIKLVFAFIYCLVLVIVGGLSGIQRWDILLYVALIQVAMSLFVFFRSIITAYQWFRADAWLSVADKTLMILSCGILLYFPSVFGPVSIERFLFLQLACMTTAILVAVAWLLKKGISFSPGSKWFPEREVFKQAIPFGIIVLLMGAHSRMDAFLLERIHPNGAYEAGIYAAAYRLLDAANMGGYLFASFMLPYIARLWSGKREITTVVLQCRHFIILYTITLIIAVVFLASWIESVLYHHDDIYAKEVLQWCLPALAGYSLVHVYGTVLTATGHVKDFARIVLVGLVINMMLNFLLIPGLGAKGCCIAALYSQLFCGIASMLYVKQKLGISLHFRSLLIYTFTGILLCGFFYGFRDWPVAPWMLILVAVMLTGAVMLATRLTGLKALIGLVQKQDI